MVRLSLSHSFVWLIAIAAVFLSMKAGANDSTYNNVPSAGTFNWSGTTATWTLAGGTGNSPAVPNAVGDVAQKATGAGNLTINQDVGGGVTVGRITQAASANFSINPTNGIILNQNGTSAGSATISNMSTAASGVLILAGGTLSLADDLAIINSGSSTNTTGAIQISSVITGTGNITLNNVSSNAVGGSASAGQIRLTGVNSFVGTVTLERGTVSFNQSSVFGASASNTIFLGSPGGGNASLIATSSLASFLNNVVVNAGSGGVLTLGSTSTGLLPVSGTVLLNGDLRLYSESTTTNAVVLSNVVSGSGALTTAGTGNSRLTGVNTFTGDTRISSGTLQLGAASGNNTLALQNSTLDMNGSDTGSLWFGTAVTSSINSATLGGLKGSRNIVLVNSNTTTPSAVALTVGNNNSSNTYSGTLSGAGSFIKSGTGTQTLSGVSTYTGSTTVNAGTLLVTGGLSASSAITVNNGGKFSLGSSVTLSNEITVSSGGRIGGNGTYSDASGIILGSGAIAAPGDSPGNTTYATDLTLQSGAVYEWELGAYGTVAGVDSDLLTISGAGNVLTFDSGSIFTLNFLSPVLNPDNAGTGSFWLSNRQWLIAEAVSGGSIVDSGLMIQAPSSFTNGSFSISSSGGNLYLNYAIPEPGTSVLVGLGLVGILYGIRRRKA